MVRRLIVIFAIASLSPFAAGQSANRYAPPSAQDTRSIINLSNDILDDAGWGDGQNRSREVFQMLEEQITAEPNNAMLLVTLARAFIVYECRAGRAGCSERSKELLDKAVKLDPKLPEAHALLAQHSMNSNCMPCADRNLAAGRRAAPKHPLILLTSSRFYRIAGNVAAAEELSRQAIQALPDGKRKGGAYADLAEIYKETQQHQQADEAYRNALRLLPKSAYVRGNYAGWLITARGDYDQAIPLAREALGIMDYGMARQYLALGQYEKWATAWLVKSPDAPKLLVEGKQNDPDTDSVFQRAAVYVGTSKTVQAMLSSNMVPQNRIDAKDIEGETPLITSVAAGNTVVVGLLLQKGANVNAKSRAGETPLMRAAMWGQPKVAALLIEKGANAKTTDEDRRTALHYLSFGKGIKEDGLLAVAKLLAAQKVDVNALDTKKQSALGYAIGERGSLALIRLLLDSGANMNAPEADNQTALVSAIMNRRADVVAELLKRKVSLDVSYRGMDPQTVADRYGGKEIGDLLRNATAI